MARRTASTAGNKGSPSNRILWTGAERTTIAAVSASTSSGSLNNAQGRCQYFLAKSVDQTARIVSVRDDESRSNSIVRHVQLKEKQI
uniref:Uncharacterized protein n=1 Tax=Romanomermis culicivorax TaxID=13658 RepID=A0A915HPW0_ROMCU